MAQTHIQVVSPMTPIPELERMRSLNYQEGKAYIEENPFAQPLVHRLEADCPHLDRRDIVALFHLRNEELVQATAHRLEYNATHDAGPQADFDRP